MRVLIVIALATLSSVTSFAQSTDIRIGTNKQLFLDHRFIDASENVQIVMNGPRKVGPVLKPDRRWEDFRLTSYFTILQDGELCRMYYSCFSEDQWNFADADVTWRDYAFLCYAESNDGIHWRKPNLGIVEYNGSKENNILARSIVDGTVFIDPSDAPERRYKILHTVGPHAGGLRLSTSADGIHFKWADEPIKEWGPDSQQNMFYDRRLGKHVAYLRARPSMKARGYDDNLGRQVVRVELDDPTDWSEVEPRVVFQRDQRDSNQVDFYTNACVEYPWADDAYFMFPGLYHHFPPEYGNDGLLDCSAAVSRDGKTWHRIDRRPYVALGEIGEWDAMFIMMGVGMVRHGDTILQYYNGIDFGHGGTRAASKYSAIAKDRRRWGWIGAVEQRLDGFFSVDATNEGGSITTPPVIFQGNRLTLNLNASAAGMAHVELRDQTGTPLPAFALADCDPIMGNDVRHPISWGGNADVSTLNGKPVRIHIQMRSAKLYAFQFTNQ